MNARETYNRIEFWLVTITAAAIVLGFLMMSKNADLYGSDLFTENRVSYNFWKHLFLPVIAQVVAYYCSYLFLVRLLEDQRSIVTKIGSLFGIFLLLGTVISSTNTYLDAWMFGHYDKNTAYLKMFAYGFTTVAIVFIICAAYFIIKETILKQVEAKKRTPRKWSTIITVVSIILSWIVLLIIFGSNNAEEGVAVFGIGVPYIAFLVWVHWKYLLPIAGKKPFLSSAYLIRIVPIVLLLSFLAAALFMGIVGNDDYAEIFFPFFFLSMLILLPMIWYVVRRRAEKHVLQTALGNSEANLDFLRSQINPHFLFNALNTLYGTALQENAHRTGEGVQKLGDMMRFMLHENMQDKISLSREVEYINNYIELQKLRTATSPNIDIITNIDEQLNRLEISPMLLIPFVENAFKHGISLQEPSFINVSLHTKENELYFDINNSVHLKGAYDPEKMKSGIGLQNVRQRLNLLYPQKHELIIRESAKAFFVHLTISL